MNNITKTSKATFLLGLMAIMMAGLSFTSCHKKLGITTIEIEDSIRHYPPVILGDRLDMVYVITNTGNEILVITDIQPSVPTIEVSENNVTNIPPGESAAFRFSFHSDKNVALTEHIIRIFGNIYPKGLAEIFFDTHVVRPSIDLSDYEEVFQKTIQSSGEHLLDGRYSEKGYFTDEDYHNPDDRYIQ